MSAYVISEVEVLDTASVAQYRDCAGVHRVARRTLPRQGGDSRSGGRRLVALSRLLLFVDGL